MTNITHRLLIFILISLCLFPVAILASSEHSVSSDHHSSSHESDEHDSHEDDESHDHDEHAHGDEEHIEGNIWLAFGITTGCGMAALIGYCSIFCIKQQMIGLISSSLAFSAGVIIYLSFMNLIPESFELFNHAINDKSEALAHFYVLLCIICGVFITLALDTLFKKMGIHSHGSTDNIDKIERNEANVLVIESAEDGPMETKQSDLSYISYSVAAALILHHFPEGIATFISLYYDLKFGAMVALALALHDIPSGVCIAVTSFVATGSRVKPFILCLIAALVYPFGAFIGWIIVKTASDIFIDAFIGILFGITAGIMLYIAFIELLPNAILSAAKHQNCMHKQVWTAMLALIFAGFLIMDVSSIVLAETGGHSH